MSLNPFPVTYDRK